LSFLKKVEEVLGQKSNRVVHKPAKANKPVRFNQAKATKKPAKPAKANKTHKPVKFEKSKGSKTHRRYLKRVEEQLALGKIKTTQTNFLRIRQVLPEFNEMMQLANPFDIPDASWGAFFAEAAPKILVALLWDMGQLKEKADRDKVYRYFKQRVRR